MKQSTNSLSKETSFQIISGRQEFLALQPAWDQLFEQSATAEQLFLQFDWNRSYFETFEGLVDLKLVCGTRQNQLVLVWPMVESRVAGVRILHWMGEPFSQYGDVLLAKDISDHETDKQQILQAAFNTIISQITPDLISLRKIRADGTLFGFLQQAGYPPSLTQKAPYIDLTGCNNFEDFNKRFSQRSRKSKRRHRRKLAEHGELRFSLFSESNEAEANTRLALDFKRQWLRDKLIYSPAFQGDYIDTFFTRLSKQNGLSAGVVTSALLLDEKPVALEIGLISKLRYGAHVGSYDKAYIQHSPGTLQIEDTIKALIEMGVETIDLFAPSDRYKLAWTDLSVDVHDYAIGVSLKGKLYQNVYLNFARKHAKKWLEILSNLKLRFRR